MFCSQCGKELPENSKFCHECGNKLLSSSEIVTEKKTKTQIVSKDGQDIEQTIERTVEQPNLGSKNIGPQKQTQTSKLKIIIWSIVIFLIVFLVASSIYDLILFGLGQSTEWVGFLAVITAGIFAGWYYLAEKEKRSKDQAIYTNHKKTIFPNSKAKKNFISGLTVIIIIVGLFVIFSINQIGNALKTDSVVNTKINAPCALGSIKSKINGQCVTREQYCQEKHGVNSKWDGNNCNCKFGYVWNNDKTSCIFPGVACTITYGNYAYSAGFDSTGTNICDCMVGYKWNNSDTSKATACILNCNSNQCLFNGKCINRPPNSHCVNDGVNAWKCDVGYNESGGSCVVQKSNDEICRDLYGINSFWREKTRGCECRPGYVFNVIDNCVTKVSIDQICQQEYGINSYYLGYFKDDKYGCKQY